MTWHDPAAGAYFATRTYADVGAGRYYSGDMERPTPLGTIEKEIDMATATKERSDAGEQEEMFPELNMKKPAEEKLLKLVKKYHRVKSARDEVLGTQKELVDAAKANVIAQMHECGISRFKYNGIVCETAPGEEKLTVKFQTDEADEENEE